MAVNISMLASGLMAVCLLAAAPYKPTPEPKHIFGETAVDQYFVVSLANLVDGEITLRVETDHAEFPGAKRRLQFDENRDGLLIEDELKTWRQDALGFASRHTRLQWNDQPLALRPNQAPDIDLYDFAQAGAKPVREVVYFKAKLPEMVSEQGAVLNLVTSYRSPSEPHVCRMFVTEREGWQVQADATLGDGMSYEALRLASKAGAAPDGFRNAPVYQQRWRLRPGATPPVGTPAVSSIEGSDPVPGEDDSVEKSPYSSWMNELGEKLFDRANPVAWWLGVFLAFGYGMAHALSPGHGKALVSAWLLGRKGRLSDAVIAGLAATFTHTILVFGLGIAFTALRFFTVEHMDVLDRWLSLSAGVVTIILGLWLFRRANLGQAHQHAHHHHDHHGGSTDHHVEYEGGHHHAKQAGIVGALAGMAPCPTGIFIVMFAAGQSAPALGLFYAFVFSLGMALVLVAISVGVIFGLRFGGGLFTAGQRLLSAAPFLSSLVIVALGVWIFAGAASRLGVVG